MDRLASGSTKFRHICSLANNQQAVPIRRIAEGIFRNYRTTIQFLMRNISLITVAIMVLLLAGGIAFLAMWEIPAPSAPVQKVLLDDRFPR